MNRRKCARRLSVKPSRLRSLPAGSASEHATCLQHDRVRMVKPHLMGRRLAVTPSSVWAGVPAQQAAATDGSSTPRCSSPHLQVEAIAAQVVAAAQVRCAGQAVMDAVAVTVGLLRCCLCVKEVTQRSRCHRQHRAVHRQRPARSTGAAAGLKWAGADCTPFAAKPCCCQIVRRM